jgi:MFS family permease
VQFLQGVNAPPTPVDLSALVSLLSIVIGIAFLAGISYAVVAIPAQTQLQEDLPEEVRGRVFGVLNMLVSVASFLPIIIVGPIADLIGTAAVIFVVAIGVLAAGVASVLKRQPSESTIGATADPNVVDPIAAALGADRPRWREDRGAPSSAYPGVDRRRPVPSVDRADEAGAVAAGPADPPDRD